MYFDPELTIPDDHKTLADGAIAPWANSSSPYFRQTLEGIARHFGASMREPFRDLPEAVQKAILYGTGDTKVKLAYDDGLRSYNIEKPFEGVIPNMRRRWRETDSAWVREELAKYQNVHPCEVCGGYRLKPEALAVKINGLHAGEV
jgi:excinuclease ABC subunit A